MLTIHDLRVQYGAHEVLKGIDLQMPAGKVHGLMGINGSGKTSLLNALYGLIPYSGAVQWERQPLKSYKIAYLPAENHFYPRMTGKEYLSLFRAYHPAFAIDEWNELFELPLHKLVEDYSTGMKKKLALMGTIALGRPVFMLDEPFNGLDMESSYILKYVIQKLAGPGRMVIVTSHIMESLSGMCQEIHHLSSGHIVKTYQPDDYHLIEDDLFRELREDKLSRLDSLLG